MKDDAREGTWAANRLERSAPAPLFESRRGALVRVLMTLYCLLVLLLMSMRVGQHAAIPGRFAAQIEEVNSNIPGARPDFAIAATDKGSAYRAILADDEAMWYGQPALCDDASRLVYVGGRIDSRGYLIDTGLYVAEVALDRLGRPRKAGAAARIVPFSDIPVYAIVPRWQADGNRLLYDAPIRTGNQMVHHIYIADLRTRKVLDLTPRSLHGAANPAYSEQSRKVAFTGRTIENGEKRWDVYTIRPDGTGLRRLTHPGNTIDVQNVFPRWTKDGKEVVYAASDTVFRIPANGFGPPRPVE